MKSKQCTYGEKLLVAIFIVLFMILSPKKVR